MSLSLHYRVTVKSIAETELPTACGKQDMIALAVSNALGPTTCFLLLQRAIVYGDRMLDIPDGLPTLFMLTIAVALGFVSSRTFSRERHQQAITNALVILSSGLAVYCQAEPWFDKVTLAAYITVTALVFECMSE